MTYVRYGEKVYSPIIDKGEADIIIAAIGKPDFDFDRRHATSVEDFSCKNFNNFSHLAIL